MKLTRLSILFVMLCGLFFSVQMFQVAIGQTPAKDANPKVLIMDKVGPSDVLGDMYGPVSFRHAYHSDIVRDCSICHHYFDDHYNDQVVPAEKCDACHASDDFDSMSRQLPCDTCHSPESGPEIRVITAEDGSVKTIPGLKAAYHRNCLDCHDSMGGPSGCGECHLANVPDHSELISSYNGSGTCEECHPGKIEEVQDSTHYRFSQPYAYSYLTGDDRPEETGVLYRPGRLWGTDAITAWDSNFPGACKNCHVGYGLIPYTSGEEKIFAESEFGNVDCLICHVQSEYSTQIPDRLSRNFAGLLPFAKQVTRTTPDTCKRCHTALSSSINAVSPVYSGLRGTAYEESTDVHAALGMTCFDCHYEQAHRFHRQVSAGLQAADSPNDEQNCSRCHREVHTNDNYRQMTEIMSCTACHIPDIGGAIEINLENSSSPTEMKSQVVYKWFNRTADIFGNPNGDTGNGMIFPYKMAIIREPIDADGNIINVDPATGTVMGEIDSWREREVFLPMSHGITLDTAYTCNDCHSESPIINWYDMDFYPPDL